MAESPSELQNEIEKLEARHAEHPEGRFFVPLANAYRRAGELERAEAVLRQGLRQHPDYLSAHIVLGRCLADRGATAEAGEEFQYVLSVDPQNLIALRTLGELAVGAGESGDAARWYEQLLAVDPMNEEARRALESLPAVTGAEPETAGGWWDGPAESAPSEPLPTLADPEGERSDAEQLSALLSSPPAYDAPDAEPAPGPYAAALGPAGGGFAHDDGEFGAGDGESGGEVVTETIAELYARQGLYDRAAEVYRELIRRRAGEPALVRRLAELETLALGIAPVETPAPPAASPVQEAVLEPEPFPVLDASPALPAPVDELPMLAGDPFAESFEFGFQEIDFAEDALLEPEPEPALAPQPVFAARRGATIAEYLSELVAWRPGGQAAVQAAAREEPARQQPEVAEPWESAPAAASYEPEPPSPAPPSAGDDALFPWESPVEVAEAAEEAVEMEEDAFSIESLFADVAPPAVAPEAPPTVEEPEAPVASEAPAAPEPTVSPAAPAAPAAADEEDDLESFQAWLRSLKR